MTVMSKGGWHLLLVFVCGVQAISGYVEALAGNVDIPATPHWEPQVAMVCGEKAQYHNKYLTEAGKWVNDLDGKATCSRDKIQILKYCQKVYHNKEITNIVEASSYLKLKDWCKTGHKKCRGSHWVKPYRCLEGKFQSDALLVPDGCQFNHVHNESQCVGYESWNHTARDYCRSHAPGMELKSFGMLLPCGIDLFRGVEFVCCPEHTSVVDSSSVKASVAENSLDARKDDEDEDDDDDYEDFYEDYDDEDLEDDEEDDYDEKDEDKEDDDDDDYDYDYESDEDDDDDDEEEVTTTTTPPSTPDPYFTHFNARNEHDDFRAAEERMEAHHRQKITKVMKDWADLEERYQELKKQDPEGAEQFRQQMTSRFQATVHALEAEVGAEKKQLLAMHQQRVLAHIHRRKKDAMNCYTSALNERPPTSRRVEKCLQKLLRALHKDRHHTLAHYKHLLNTNLKRAESEKSMVLSHLEEIDKMVNQSLNMLSRFPSLSRKLVPLMKEYVEALKARDSTPSHLLVNSEEQLLDSYTEQAKQKMQALKEKQAEEAAARARQQAARQEKKRLMYEQQQKQEELQQQHIQQNEQMVHHAMADPLEHEQASYSVHRKIMPENKSVYLTMAFAGVALTTALVAGIVVLRRRNTPSPRSQGFIEVDQGVTPEERHVANMQINGYENPTYKYFENQEA